MLNSAQHCGLASTTPMDYKKLAEELIRAAAASSSDGGISKEKSKGVKKKNSKRSSGSRDPSTTEAPLSAHQRQTPAAQEGTEAREWSTKNPCYLCTGFGHRAKDHDPGGAWPDEWARRWETTRASWTICRGFLGRKMDALQAGTALGIKVDDLGDLSRRAQWSVLLARLAGHPRWLDAGDPNETVSRWSSLPVEPADDMEIEGDRVLPRDGIPRETKSTTKKKSSGKAKVEVPIKMESPFKSALRQGNPSGGMPASAYDPLDPFQTGATKGHHFAATPGAPGNFNFGSFNYRLETSGRRGAFQSHSTQCGPASGAKGPTVGERQVAQRCAALP